MAAPPEITIKNLNCVLVMDKALGDDPEDIFLLQGMGFLTRKTLRYATVTLHMTEKEENGVIIVTSDQTITGGVKGTTEVRILNWEPRAHEDKIFGKVVGNSRFVEAEGNVPALEVQTKVADPKENEAIEKFLKGETLADGKPTEGFVVDEQNTSFLQSWVVSQENGWTAEQIWGFEMIDGQRRHTRRAVVAKGKKVVKARLVYTYQSAL
ncbi:hypothetical protein AAP_01389 [Ascosphaera apis ARSEF 7405]|uniref:Uncharacterized protein n=1 Tax=Ascosphaera apis ARSEF 7405 TaxID=392613 RepID=A0A162IMV0_9EURO|nr:hypothetical protein AAP_01389 [Ascosphaera apis ARSEF 7405]